MNISGECTQDMIDFSVTLALLRGGYKTHSEVFTSVCLLKWRVINPKTRQLAFTLENKKSVDPIVTHFMATEVVLFLNSKFLSSNSKNSRRCMHLHFKLA